MRIEDIAPETVVRNADRRQTLFSHQANMDWNIANSGMNSENQRNIIRVAIDDLFTMDGHELA